MNPALWNEIVASVQPTDDYLTSPAEDRLRREATIEDIPKLLELLRSDKAPLREVAVMPLIESAGPRVLPELFDALQRGLDEDRTESLFFAGLMHLPDRFPAETRATLLQLRKSASESVREHSEWLLEFCGGADGDA